MTQRVFVANRGEVAVRIIDACDRLGFETVLGVSAADRGTLGARRATRTVVLGGPQPRDSYLSVEAVLHAAVATGCTALHPGYGFLSERPELARRCAEAGIVFIGPSPEALEALPRPPPHPRAAPSFRARLLTPAQVRAGSPPPSQCARLAISRSLDEITLKVRTFGVYSAL